MQPDYLGSLGGQLAMAFGAGCVATFVFMSTIGSLIWKLVGDSRQSQIKQLRADLRDEKENCARQLEGQRVRIEQLETILLFETVGGLRQDAAKALAELKGRYRIAEIPGDDIDG